MQSTPVTFSKLFTSELKYIIPVYQRKYTWKNENCETLLNDIMELYHNPDSDKGHFFGTCAFAPSGSDDNQLLIIDGQQRLTTVSILLKAIQDVANSLEEKKINFHNYFYTENPDCKEEDTHILRLNHTHKSDEEIYKRLFTSNDKLRDSNQFFKNYKYLRNTLKDLYKHLPRQETSSFFTKLRKIITDRLYLVQLLLDKTEDPQIIFQTINSTGVPLTIDELIKNYLLLEPNTENKSAESLYDDWMKIENTANIFSGKDADKKNKSYFKDFIRSFIIYKTNNPKISKSSHNDLSLYEYFTKQYPRSCSKTLALKEIFLAIKVYRYISRGDITWDDLNLDQSQIEYLNRSETSLLIRKFRDTKQESVYPFLMHLIIDFLSDQKAIKSAEILTNSLQTYLKYVFQLTLSEQNKYLGQQASRLFKELTEDKKTTDTTDSDICQSFDAKLSDTLTNTNINITLYNRNKFIDHICTTKLSLETIRFILNDLSDMTFSNNCSIIILNTELSDKSPKNDFLGNVTLSSHPTTNASASDFGSKLQIIRSENINCINDDFSNLNTSQWTEQNIIARTRRLAECLADRYVFNNQPHEISTETQTPSSQCTINTPNKAILFGKTFDFDKSNTDRYWLLFKDLVKELAKKIKSIDDYDIWTDLLPGEPDDDYLKDIVFTQERGSEQKAIEIKLTFKDKDSTLKDSIYLNYFNTPATLRYFQNTLLPLLNYSPSDITFE
ncbi:MAG: DUF262 domain-containing protein [Proteobacteria bacterium]|nr:DUF262 domain-containing protein [Pseudomonadota bacterium]